ncbi:MAG: hypothetical protein HQL41_10820 [Alphaproteobacteria bacterium]|nr:hypothetical protein [Alphaproteobacteria bacterium]
MTRQQRKVVRHPLKFHKSPARGKPPTHVSRIKNSFIEIRILNWSNLLTVWHNTKIIELQRDPKGLVPYGTKVFSQNDEDGIIAEIFRRINTTNRMFVEIGVGATENNTLFLLLQGWSGVWADADRPTLDEAARRYATFRQKGRLTLVHAYIGPDNIETLLEASGVPAEPDLLSLDIDGNDYHVLEAIRNWRPRVLILEYNAQFGPESGYVMPFNPNHGGWPGNMAFGAALSPITELCESKGYALVGCNYNGVNAFFVRQDLVGSLFSAPFTAVHHWRPFVHPILTIPPVGHPVSDSADLSNDGHAGAQAAPR